MDVSTTARLPVIRDFQALNKYEALVLLENGNILRLNLEGVSKDTHIPGRTRTFYFLDKSKGWVLGEDGRVWATGFEQGYSNRASLETDVGVSARQMTFANENVGWLVDAFSVWLTKDAGYSWNRIYPNKDYSYNTLKAQPTRYSARNPNIGWLGLSNGKVLKTSDGGNSWEEASLKERLDIRSVWGVSDTECWVGTFNRGGGLFHTLDAGQSWNKISFEDSAQGFGINSISFAGKDFAWAVGRRFETGTNESPKSSAILLRTRDGGVSWSVINTGLKEQEFEFVEFVDRDSGWLVGETNVYKTNNAGNSWTAILDVNGIRAFTDH
jgi:photosystem II stability/assembly factor-like uncharacterized protein